MSEAETLSPVIPDQVDRATRLLLERACRKELSLATAESCTGGMIASLLTDVPGASHAFERGFVVYTEEAKTDLLDVPADLIDDKGVVSRDVAIAMAQGALAHSKADIALSVTGFAGEGDEPGLVHFACARREGATAHQEEHFGDIGRGAIRIECMRVAVEMMSEAVGNDA